MPVMKVLLDQFARCFNAAGGIHEEDDDNRQSSSSHSKRAQSSQPLQTSGDESSNKLTAICSGRHGGSGCHLEHCTSAMSESDREQAQFLAQTRQKASASTQRHKSSISLESSSKETKMEKARHKSNKRKLDIFRNVDKPLPQRNSFSKFLSTHKSSAGSMLCFANPIFDSQDDDPRQNRGDNSTVNDEDTITSTLYFDAKYAHLVEQQSPVALYREWSLEEKDSKDDIVKMFEAGIQKSIKTVDLNPKMNPSSAQNEGSALLSFPRTRSSKVSNNSANASATSSVISGLEMSPEGYNVEGVENDSPPTVHLSVPSPPEFTSRNLITIEEMFDEAKSPPAINLTSKTSIGTARTISSSNSHSSSPRLRLKRREEVLNVTRISELESCYHED